MNEEQSRIWNGPAGAAWVESQQSLDDMFKGFEAMLVDAVSARGATHVLDVGCGTGGTTLAIARAIPRGRCTGIDISQPMIDLARSRASQAGIHADFIVADAQTQALPTGVHDMIVSRFGVMFFEDPVRAFTNLRQAAAANGALLCQVFRAADQNPFMTAAERAAAPLLPDLPPRAAGPGQFAFADERYVRGILEAAGWAGIRIEPIDVECGMPASELDRYLMRLGPVGLALRSSEDGMRKRVLDAVRAAFDPYVRGAEVRFTAACWRLAALATS